MKPSFTKLILILLIGISSYTTTTTVTSFPLKSHQQQQQRHDTTTTTKTTTNHQKLLPSNDQFKYSSSLHLHRYPPTSNLKKNKLIILSSSPKKDDAASTSSSTRTTNTKNNGMTIPSSSSRKTILFTALLSLASLLFLGQFQILRGPPTPISPTTAFSPYSTPLLLRDTFSSLLCCILGYILTKLFSTAANNGTLSSRDSRKWIHTLSAPLFIAVGWPLFSNAVDARYFATLVPFLNAMRIVVAGSSSEGDEKELAGALSRSGDIKEALGGPFIYVLILAAATFCFWRDNLVGVIAMSTMAAGDGMADLIGRRYGKNNKWFFSPQKSVAGTLAFFIASTVCSVALSLWLGYTGTITLPPLDVSSLVFRIAVISALCAIVELLPFLGDDNWTVPLSAAFLSFVLLR